MWTNALASSSRAWFAAAVVGQWIFAAYVANVYGKAIASGNLMGWNVAMPRGYVPGDTPGNITIGLHLLFALVMLLGGPTQILPQVRTRFPRFHHWTGRVYLFAAVLMSLGGLYLVWIRGTVGGLGQHLGITLNALLLLVCAAMTLREALNRRFDHHRRWALRLFLVTGGVWFFRISLMLTLMIFRRPIGFDPKTFEGPLLTFLSFGQTLIPLAVLELYFRAQRQTNRSLRIAIATLLAILTLATTAGIAAATLGMWLPRL